MEVENPKMPGPSRLGMMVGYANRLFKKVKKLVISSVQRDTANKIVRVTKTTLVFLFS